MENMDLMKEIFEEVVYMNDNGFNMWLDFSGHVDTISVRGCKGKSDSFLLFELDTETDTDNKKGLENLLTKIRNFKESVYEKNFVCKNCDEKILINGIIRFCPICGAENK